MRYNKFFCILIICLIFSTSTYAKDVVPEKIRVGLFYLNSAVNSVNLESQTGFKIGYYSDNSFKSLIKNEKLTNVVVKKDICSSGIPAYHIQIDNSYDTYSKAVIISEKFKNEGYVAFPVYNDTWRVWIGNYNSESSANSNTNELKSNMSSYSYSIVQPSDNNIIVVTNSGEVKLLFSSKLKTFEVLPIQVEDNPNVIFVNEKPYRGSIKIIRQKDSDMTIINEVSLNEYLYGVVPSEMPCSWHVQALKAQAVAARTFAINSINSYKVNNVYNPLGFDVTPTTEFQVYRGYSNENKSTNKAVDETKGEIIYYNNTPISAFFFSCSGGYTENSENIWVSEVPYLRAVEDKYQPKDFDKRYWSVFITPSEIQQYYEKENIDIGDITDIKVTKYSQSKNALEMKVIGTKGEKVYKKLSIRYFLQGKNLPSLTFKIKKQGGLNANILDANLKTESRSLDNAKVITKDGTQNLNNDHIYVKSKNSTKKLTSSPLKFVFDGEGAGHGVGMSQWGARGMAEAGFKYDKILKHYYTGVKVRQ